MVKGSSLENDERPGQTDNHQRAGFPMIICGVSNRTDMRPGPSCLDVSILTESSQYKGNDTDFEKV